jgi:uroporphyrinogen decarboxylase
MWREIYFENYRKAIGLAHSHGLKVMVHSCGSIRGIMADLIEAGMDILDPVQTTADDMEPVGLKEDFGDRIVFHGAVDTQGVLPNASEEGVEQHVREILRVLGRDGGYIFAPCNAIQADTPPENVEAMYRAVKEYRPGVDV